MTGVSEVMSGYEHVGNKSDPENTDIKSQISPALATLIQHIQQQSTMRVCYFPDTQQRLCIWDQLFKTYVNDSMTMACMGARTLEPRSSVQMDQWSGCEQVVAPLLRMRDCDLNGFFEDVEQVLPHGGWLLAAWMLKGSFDQLTAQATVPGSTFVSMDTLLISLQRPRFEKPVLDCDRYMLDYACATDAIHDHCNLGCQPIDRGSEGAEAIEGGVSCLLEIASLAVHIRPQARQSMQSIDVQVRQSSTDKAQRRDGL